MTVQQIINQLQEIKDKSMNVVFTTPIGFIDVDAINYCDWANVTVLSTEEKPIIDTNPQKCCGRCFGDDICVFDLNDDGNEKQLDYTDLFPGE